MINQVPYKNISFSFSFYLRRYSKITSVHFVIKPSNALRILYITKYGNKFLNFNLA